MPVPLPFGPPDARNRQPYYGGGWNPGSFINANPFDVSDDFDSAYSMYGTAAQQAQATGLPVERPGGLLSGVASTLDKFVSAGSGFVSGLFGADLIGEDGTVDRSDGGLDDAWRRAKAGAGGQHYGWGDWEPLKFDEDDSGLERFGKGLAAFTGDVLSDPLTYISFGTSIGRGAASRVAAGSLHKVAKESAEELFEAAGKQAMQEGAETATRRQLIEEGKRTVVSELDNRTVLGSVLNTNRYDLPQLQQRFGTDELFDVDTRQLVNLLDESELDEVMRTVDGGVSALSPRSKDIPESAMPGSIGQSLTELAVNTVGEGAYRIGGARRLRTELNRLFGDYGDDVFKRMHPDVTGGARLRVPFVRDNVDTGKRAFGVLGDKPRAAIPLYPGQTGGGQVIDSKVGRLLGLDKVVDSMEAVRKWVSSRDMAVSIADKLGGRWGGLAAQIMQDVAQGASEAADSPGAFTRLVTHRLAAEGRERFRLQATEAYENLIRNVPDEWKQDTGVHAKINNLLSEPETLAQVGDDPDDVTSWARELREFYDRWGTQLEELGLIPPRGEGRRVNYIPHLVKDEYLDDVRAYRIDRNPNRSGTNVGSGHGNLRTRQYDEFWRENQEWLEENGLDVFALEDPVLFNQAIEAITEGRVSDVFVENPFEVFNEYQRRMLSMVAEYHYAALMKRLGIVVEGDALNEITKRVGGLRFWQALGPDPDEGVPIPGSEPPGTDWIRIPQQTVDATPVDQPRLEAPWRGGERVTPDGYPPATAGGLPEPTSVGAPDGYNVDVSTVPGDMSPAMPRLGEVVTSLEDRVAYASGLEDTLDPAQFAALRQAEEVLALIRETSAGISDEVSSVRPGVTLEDAQRATDQAMAALDNAGVPIDPNPARAPQTATESVDPYLLARRTRDPDEPMLPNGRYYAIGDDADYRGELVQGQGAPSKPLEVGEGRRDWGDGLPTSAGEEAARELLPTTTFGRYHDMPVEVLRDTLEETYGVDLSYIDPANVDVRQQLLEVAGAQEAKRQGFDAIVQSGGNYPELVDLTGEVVSPRAAQEATESVGLLARASDLTDAPQVKHVEEGLDGIDEPYTTLWFGKGPLKNNRMGKDTVKVQLRDGPNDYGVAATFSYNTGKPTQQGAGGPLYPEQVGRLLDDIEQGVDITPDYIQAMGNERFADDAADVADVVQPDVAAESLDDIVQDITNLNPAAGYRIDRIAKAIRAGNEDLVATEQRYLADALSTQMETVEAVETASDAVARVRAAAGGTPEPAPAAVADAVPQGQNAVRRAIAEGEAQTRILTQQGRERTLVDMPDGRVVELLNDKVYEVDPNTNQRLMRPYTDEGMEWLFGGAETPFRLRLLEDALDREASFESRELLSMFRGMLNSAYEERPLSPGWQKAKDALMDYIDSAVGGTATAGQRKRIVDTFGEVTSRWTKAQRGEAVDVLGAAADEFTPPSVARAADDVAEASARLDPATGAIATGDEGIAGLSREQVEQIDEGVDDYLSETIDDFDEAGRVFEEYEANKGTVLYHGGQEGLEPGDIVRPGMDPAQPSVTDPTLSYSTQNPRSARYYAELAASEREPVVYEVRAIDTPFEDPNIAAGVPGVNRDDLANRRGYVVVRAMPDDEVDAAVRDAIPTPDRPAPIEEFAAGRVPEPEPAVTEGTMSAPTAGGNTPEQIRQLNGAAVTDDWLPQHVAGVYQAFDDVEAYPTRARGQRAIADAVYRAVSDRPDMLDFGLSPQQRTSLEAVEAAIDGKPIPEWWQEELDTYFAERFLRANGLTFEDLQEGTAGFRELERRLGYDDLLDMDEVNRIDAMAQEAFRTGNVDDLPLTRPPLDDLTNRVDAAVARLADEVDNLRFGRDAAETVARQALQGEDYSAALQRLATTVDVDGNVATRWARDLAGPEDVDADEVIDDLLEVAPTPDPEPAAATTDVPDDMRRPTGVSGRETFDDTELSDLPRNRRQQLESEWEIEGEGMVSPAQWRTRRLSGQQMFKPRKSSRSGKVSRADRAYDVPITHEGGGSAPDGVYYTNRSSIVRVPTPDEVGTDRATNRLESWHAHLDKRAKGNRNAAQVDVGNVIPARETWGPAAVPVKLRSEGGRLWIDMATPDGRTVTFDGEDWRVFEEVAETLTDADDLEQALAGLAVHVDSGPSGLAVVTFEDEVLGAMVPAAPRQIAGGADVTPDMAARAMAQESVSLLEQVENSVAARIREILDVPNRTEGSPIPPTGPPERLVTSQQGVPEGDFLANLRRVQENRLPGEYKPTAPFRQYGTEGDMLPEPPMPPDQVAQARREVFDGREIELYAYDDVMEAINGNVVIENAGRDMPSGMEGGGAAVTVDEAGQAVVTNAEQIEDAILAFSEMPHAPGGYTAPDMTAPAEARKPSPGGRRNRLELIAKAAGLDYQDAIKGSGRKARQAPAVRDSKVWHGLLMDDFTRDALKRFGREGKWEQFATAAFEPYMRWFRTQATVGRGPGFVIRNMVGGLANARLVGATSGDMLDGMAIARMWARADAQVTRPGLFGVALNEARHDAFEELVRARWSDEVADQLMEAHDLFLAQGLADIRQMSLTELADFTGRSRLFDQKDAAELNTVEQLFEKTAMGIKPVTVHTSEWTKQAEHALRFGSFMAGVRRYGIEDGGYAASQLVKASQFDYGDLSSFERNVMRQIIPFYTFTRNNLPLNFRGLFTDPAKFAHLQRGMEYVEEGLAPAEGSEGDAYSQVLPEWLEENMGLVTGIPLGGGVAALRAESPKVHLEQWLPNPTRWENPRQQIDTAVSQANPLFDILVGGLTNRDPYTGQEVGSGDGSSGKFDWFARQASPLYANMRRLTPGQGTERDESRRLGAWLSTFVGVPTTTIDEDAARGALRARASELLEQSDVRLEALSERLGIETSELKRLIREYGPGGAEAVLGVPSGTMASQP